MVTSSEPLSSLRTALSPSKLQLELPTLYIKPSSSDESSKAMPSLRDDALLDTTLLQVDFFLPMLNLITSGSTERLARKFNPETKTLRAQTSAQRKKD